MLSMQTRQFTGRQLKASNRNAFMVLGVLESSWAPLIPFIKERFLLDEGQLGLLLLCLGVGSFCALPLAGRLSARLGCRLLIRVSGLCMALALLGVAASSSLYASGAILFVFGMCTIGLDIGSNVNAVLVERELKANLMSGFHGGYSLGTLIGAGGVSALLSAGCGVLPCAALMLAAMSLWILLGCRALFADIRSRESVPEPDEKPAGRLRIPPLVLAVGCLCFIMYTTEGSVMSWSAVFAHQERGVDLEAAGFIYTAFACAMTAARLAGNAAVSRCGRRRIVALGSLLVAVGFALTALVPHVLGTVLGFALVGLGAANIVPQLVSFAGQIRGIQVHTAIALVNALGYSGILAGPVVIGFLAKRAGLGTVFLLVSGLALVVGCVCLRILRPR